MINQTSSFKAVASRDLHSIFNCWIHTSSQMCKHIVWISMKYIFKPNIDRKKRCLKCSWLFYSERSSFECWGISLLAFSGSLHLQFQLSIEFEYERSLSKHTCQITHLTFKRTIADLSDESEVAFHFKAIKLNLTFCDINSLYFLWMQWKLFKIINERKLWYEISAWKRIEPLQSFIYKRGAIHINH